MPAAYLSAKDCSLRNIMDLWLQNDGSGRQIWNLLVPAGQNYGGDATSKPIDLRVSALLGSAADRLASAQLAKPCSTGHARVLLPVHACSALDVCG